MRAGMALRFSAVLLLFAVTASGQRLSYFEGDVSVNGQTLARNDGAVFPAGAVLSTTTGRIEVRLGLDVYLRLGSQSSLKIDSNNSVELTKGFAIIDSTGANAGAVNAEMRVGDSVQTISKPGEFKFSAGPGEPDSLLDIWSANRKIRLSTRLSGSTQPEQPLIGPNTDVTAGMSASLGLIALTGIPQLMYEPILPYRPGSKFFGPSYAYWYPYYAYPAQIRTLRPLGPRPFRSVAPGVGTRPLHIPGPVIGH